MGAYDWHERAACADAGPEWRAFFSDNVAVQEWAVATYCRRCPVTDLCLAQADEAEGYKAHGVWGGLTPGRRERRRRATPHANAASP